MFGIGGSYFQQPITVPTCISGGSVFSNHLRNSFRMELGFTGYEDIELESLLPGQGPSSLNH